MDVFMEQYRRALSVIQEIRAVVKYFVNGTE
jgi:hypothetical protein